MFNCCAIAVLRTVHHVGDSIGVDRKCACYLDIACRHRCVGSLPAAERISLTGRSIDQSNRIAVTYGLCIIYLAVHLVGDCVGFCCAVELSCIGHIARNSWQGIGGVSIRAVTPTAESIGILCGCCLCRCCTVIGRSNTIRYICIGFKCSITVFPCDCVLVDNERTRDNNIFIGHCRRDFAPTAECVACFRRCFTGCQSRTVCNGINSTVNFAVHLVGNSVLVCFPLRIQRDRIIVYGSQIADLRTVCIFHRTVCRSRPACEMIACRGCKPVCCQILCRATGETLIVH